MSSVIFNTILMLFLGLLMGACTPNNEGIVNILEDAGSNKKELEKVLDYYSNIKPDSQKYKAACFLIKNMKGKYSYAGPTYSVFLKFVDSISSVAKSPEEFSQAIRKFRNANFTLIGNPTKVYDVTCMSAEFLIQNIEAAFFVYRQAPWCRNLNFDDFCNYVLPYRIGNEPLENFRYSFLDKFSYLLHYDTLTIQQVADSILSNKYVHNMKSIISFPGSLPDFAPSYLLKLKGGTCREIGNLAIYALRSMGIPVADEFTPVWPNRGIGHTWSSLIVGDSSLSFFMVDNIRSGDQHIGVSKENWIAKAYRNTYCRQVNSLALQHGDEPIPDLFFTPFFKDVTSNYTKTTDVTIEVAEGITLSKRFAYLCTFNNKKWTPIHWGKIEKSRAVFTDMGTSVAYLPAIYHSNKIVPISPPILIDSNGNIQALVPNENNLQTIILKRKYPIFGWWNLATWNLQGGRFQAANKSDFSDAKDIYIIDYIPEMKYHTIDLNAKHKYKYWRYLAPLNSRGDIAELDFYDERGMKLKGKIIGTDVIKRTTVAENAFDGDALTSFSGDTTYNNWVGMAFDTPRCISKIKYLGRNDDNFIKVGELYELKYWKNGTWKSLGQKIGTESQDLVYPNVPSNALFLLENLTKGREERIFTYEGNKQVWW